MPIKFSLAASPANPMDKNSGKKIYPHAQYNELIELKELAYNIQEHGSPFTRDVILGVLTAAVDCIREQLVMGNKVNFGDLGSLYVTLRSDGVERAEDFNPHSDIKQVEVNWAPSDLFKNIKNDPRVKYEFVPTRKEMSEAKKLSKEEADESLASGGNSGDPDSPVTPPLE